MNIFYLTGSITDESVGIWIDKLSTYEYDSDLLIYAASPGGDVGAMNVLMDYINRRFESVELVIFSFAISAMWRFANLLPNVDKIEVLGDAYAQDHHSEHGSFVTHSVTGSAVRYCDVINNLHEKGLKDWSDFCKEIGYTKQELKDLNDGKEVFFGTERMMEILNKSLALRKIN